MGAINTLDLDKQFSFNFKRKVVIGGETYNVTFDDDKDQALYDLQLEMQDFYKKQTEASDKFENKMTVDQRKQYIASESKRVLKHVEEVLDEFLSKKGAGKAIYDYYDHQSYALYKTIEVLRKTKEQLDGTAELERRKKHKARAEQYTQRKKRVKDYADANKKRHK